MEWTGSLKAAIAYMEEHLLEEISAEDVAESVHISPFYLQKGFRIMTGYSIGEYIRYRRLYMAALDLLTGKDKIIDLAYKYKYDTPESFAKAFGRFHGMSPAQLKKNPVKIKTFLPLKITIQVQGGNNMDVTIEKKKGFQVIGLAREVLEEECHEKLPKFWEEFQSRYLKKLCFEKCQPEGAFEQAVCDYNIGEYGVCIDDSLGKNGKVRYMIAGTYSGGKIPEGMEVYEFPETEWAVFRCVGPMPGALQTVNDKIFKEWLPGNEEFEIAIGTSVEWYEQGDNSSVDYESAIWIPVKRKKA